MAEHLTIRAASWDINLRGGRSCIGGIKHREHESMEMTSRWHHGRFMRTEHLFPRMNLAFPHLISICFSFTPISSVTLLFQHACTPILNLTQFSCQVKTRVLRRSGSIISHQTRSSKKRQSPSTQFAQCIGWVSQISFLMLQYAPTTTSSSPSCCISSLYLPPPSYFSSTCHIQNLEFHAITSRA